MDFNNMQEDLQLQEPVQTKMDKAFYTPTGGNAFQKLSVDAILKKVVEGYYADHNIPSNPKVAAVMKRKRIFAIISALINMILFSLVFFHVSFWIFVLLSINLLVFAIFMLTYKSKKYIIKQIKARPDEKFSYVIASTLASQQEEKSASMRILGGAAIALWVVSIALPAIVFMKPHFLYEQYDANTYYVRYYTVGLTNPDTITVPCEYQGKPVVGVRGNVFKNIVFIRKIVFPNTVTVIRGETFANDTMLLEVVLPENLTYLGGGAFKNCSLLQTVNLPDSLTELNGEMFVNCKSLKTITLPKHITEIHGNTFEECTSLEKIVIPEGVTRIGGHAFYDCYSLYDVTLPSTLLEIGSSAFRRCSCLAEIRVPVKTVINARAFLESPTNIIWMAEVDDGTYDLQYEEN